MKNIKRLEDVYEEQVINRGKEYVDNVASCIKIGDYLCSEVHGTYAYKTKVHLITLKGECSCPYEYNCKHAVATYLYHEKGKSSNADEFLNYLKTLQKDDLIEIIKTILPEHPELIKKQVFRKKTNFQSFVDDFIHNFSEDEIENINENIDCLNFEQLLKLLKYIDGAFDSLNEKLTDQQDTYNNYDDEDDPLSDLIYTARKELITKINSPDQLILVLKQECAVEEIIENGEKFFRFKDVIKQYFGKEEYFHFLLNCKNPDLTEIKDTMPQDAQHYFLLLSRENPSLSEKLATYLNNADLKFINAYQHMDANEIITHFDRFSDLENKYVVQPQRIVTILSTKKHIMEDIAKRLFTKEHFGEYSQKNIKFLLRNLNDQEFILKNIDFQAEFPKVNEAIRRLQELGYATKSIFKRKELIEGKHWTHVVEILHSVRKSFGDKFAKEFILANKDTFSTSSTLKHNLKKEGILIQKSKGELTVEVVKWQ